MREKLKTAQLSAKLSENNHNKENCANGSQLSDADIINQLSSCKPVDSIPGHTLPCSVPFVRSITFEIEHESWDSMDDNELDEEESHSLFSARAATDDREEWLSNIKVTTK